jgi:ADP-heptose:LPS heptosyltransferase
VRTDLEARTVEELSAGGRILVTRLQFLGDVILTLPAVYAIRERFPRAEIDYLSRRDGADILAGEPIFSRIFKLPDTAGATWGLALQLRRRKYAAAVDLFSNPRSAMLSWLSGARLRIGGDRRVRRRLYTHPITISPSVRSAIDHHLGYLEPIDVETNPRKPQLTLSDEERKRGREHLYTLGLAGSSGTVIGIHPGGKWEVKRWPIDHFADLARRLSTKHGVRIAVLTGPGEEPYRDALRSRLGDGAVYLPTLPIRETAAVIEALDGLVVCDGGIMHVSVAVGTPTVGIFGSSQPDIWFPYETFGPYAPACFPIDCRPCHSHVCDHLSCLGKLTVETIERQLLGVLETKDKGTRRRPR